MQKATISYFLRGEGPLTEVLLYTKLTQPMAGFLTGPGGKREGDEDSRVTAARESGEETGLIVQTENIEESGAIGFYFTEGEKIIRGWLVMMSRVKVWSGSPEPKPKAGLENPEWHTIYRLPLSRLASSARIYLPKLLMGKKVGGSLTYDAHMEVLSNNMTIEP